jgi:hypothetical protein
MKKLLLSLLIFSATAVIAQDPDEKENDRDKEKEKVPFKETLFTGGSISLAFYNNTFLIGASPVIGTSLTNWLDAGVVINYTYTSYRDVNAFDDRLRQTVYGGGVFTKIYPVRFLFAQAQVEHNIVRQKYVPPAGGLSTITKDNATSFLVGAGYTTGRQGRGGEPFYYLAVLFDLSNDVNSPYTDAYGRTIPIIRGGLQIPLFQRKRMN